MDNIIQNRPQCISSQKVFFAFLFVCAVCRVMWRVKTITKILAELAGCLGSWPLHFFSPACHTGNQFSRNCSKCETAEKLLFAVRLKILAELAGCLGNWPLHFFSTACHTGNQCSRNYWLGVHWMIVHWPWSLDRGDWVLPLGSSWTENLQFTYIHSPL